MKEDKLDKVVSAVVKAIDKRMNKKPKSYYTQAEVLRVDKQDKTAYVHIPGGVDQTPATLTIDAKVGDTVEVRVGEGRAFIVGNETNPPSDNETAEEAKETASSALSHSLESVVDDKLFYLASDQDTGVTVEDEGWTEEPQEPTALLPYLWVYHKYTRGSGSTFNSDPMIIAVYTEDGVSVTGVQPQYYLSTSSSSAVGGTWSNSLTYLSGYYIWTRNAISYSDGTTGYSTAIYDQALTEACSLSYNTAQYIWTETTGLTNVPTGQYVTEVNKASYRSNPTGGALLLRSDGMYLRNGANTVASFLAAGVSLFNLAGSTLAQFLSTGLTIYNGSGNTIAHLGYGSTTGESGSTTSPYYTLGYRKSSSGIGAYSLAVGPNASASGSYSTAIGKETVAGYSSQFVIGQYNNNVQGDAFEIGNGGGSRSNCFAVTNAGNVTASGIITAGGLDGALFKVTNVDLLNIPSVAAGGSTGTLTRDFGTISDVKYYPLAIAGFRTGRVALTFVRLFLTNPHTGGGTISFNLHNSSSSATDATTAEVQILWVKNTV